MGIRNALSVESPSSSTPIRTLISFLVLVALVVLFSTQASADPVNMLINSGFETGDFSGWTVTGNSPYSGVNTAGHVIPGVYSGFVPTTVVINSGANAAYAVVCTPTTANPACIPSGNQGDYLDLSQTLTLIPGDTYDVGFWVASGSSSLYGNSFIISVNGTDIDCPYCGNTTTYLVSPSYQFIGGTFVATNASSTINFHLQGSGYADGGFSFDDFTVTSASASPVPEASTVLLVGVGLLALLGFEILRKRHPSPDASLQNKH